MQNLKKKVKLASTAQTARAVTRPAVKKWVMESS